MDYQIKKVWVVNGIEDTKRRKGFKGYVIYSKDMRQTTNCDCEITSVYNVAITNWWNECSRKSGVDYAHVKV